MSEYYYGLPQEVWDSLCMEAEDLLYSEGLGNHLVGLYPAGNRIYGIESSPPGLLCLYVDSVESILDPYYSPQIYEYSIGNMMSPIIMVELRHWVQMLFRLGPNALIPCFHKDMVHQDNSIVPILEAARDALIASGYPDQLGRKDTGSWFWARAKLILIHTGKFLPCVNPEWGTKIELGSIIPNNKKLIEADKIFTETALSNNSRPFEEIFTYLQEVHRETEKFRSSAICTTPECMAAKAKLSKEVINFYRFML